MKEWKISASEIAEYAYCPMAWYLRRFEGVEPDPVRVEAGRVHHSVVGVKIERAMKLERSSRTLQLIAFLFVVVAALVLFFWLII